VAQLPFDVDDIAFLSGDFVEFAAVFVTMVFSFIVMVALGQWWQR
jgi:hypothetical protein